MLPPGAVPPQTTAQPQNVSPTADLGSMTGAGVTFSSYRIDHATGVVTPTTYGTPTSYVSPPSTSSRSSASATSNAASASTPDTGGPTLSRAALLNLARALVGERRGEASNSQSSPPPSSPRPQTTSTSSPASSNNDWTAPEWDEDLQVYISYNHRTGAERQGSIILADGTPGEPGAGVEVMDTEIAGVTVSGYVGPKAKLVNGVYRVEYGMTYPGRNGKPVYRLRDPWLNTWLHAESNGQWTICIAASLASGCKRENLCYSSPDANTPVASNKWHRIDGRGDVQMLNRFKVVQHNNDQMERLRKEWNRTYPLQLCKFVMSKPSGLLVSGVTGDNAHIINGYYERQGFLHHGAVRFNLLKANHCWLERNESGYWAFTYNLIRSVSVMENDCLCRACSTTSATPLDDPTVCV